MITLRSSRPADVPSLLEIWRGSVRATHDFLLPGDFEAIEKLVANDYLPSAPLHVAADGDGRPLAFMGLSVRHIDSLFIDPERRGQGIGTLLVRHAREQGEGPLTVDVNEQNTQAVGFYRHLGFVETGRSALDGDGRPYPLMHMRLG
ncbi:acetyltransferase [Labrys sp. KB_33_2]|uniref:acetyltransferase n=1 Tax=unclassified Labrys (in: a-proteobacteria) TaxID=2688601 RepID=UPI003EC055D3